VPEHERDSKAKTRRFLEPGANERAADAIALPISRHSKRREQDRAGVTRVRDREDHVADNATILLGDERERGQEGGARHQRSDKRGFIGAAEGLSLDLK